MNLTLGLAGLHLAVSAPRDLPVSLELAKFAVSGPPDIAVELSWDWNAMPLPQGEPDGGDDLQVFYLRPGCLCCVTKGGWKGPLAACWYWPGRRRLLCLVNAQTFPGFPQSMDSAFSLLPMRAVLMDQGVVFLHAARISAGGRGILFCGPSGMGKTTQATLWQQYRQTRILSSDRMLARRQGEEWTAYGYPLDGSAPVASTETCPLGAIVLLAQAPDNQVTPLSPGLALPRLMPQLVMETWNPDRRAAGAQLLLDLLADIPAYRLACTPDRRAVDCLANRLISDGVLEP